MPEVRLIDANAAADKIMRDVEEHADEIGIGGTAIMIAFARALRDETEFPTVDAVPVVRCGECKYMQLCGRCTMFADDKIRPSVSDFCSYGERDEDYGSD